MNMMGLVYFLGAKLIAFIYDLVYCPCMPFHYPAYGYMRYLRLMKDVDNSFLHEGNIVISSFPRVVYELRDLNLVKRLVVGAEV